MFSVILEVSPQALSALSGRSRLYCPTYILLFAEALSDSLREICKCFKEFENLQRGQRMSTEENVSRQLSRAFLDMYYGHCFAS